MTVRNATKWLTDLRDSQPIETLTVHGGEPFLYPKVLERVIRKAKDFGISHRGVITNCFWAHDEDKAMKTLHAMRNSGLTGITVSVDAFHQEYVALECVRNALEAAISIGFDRVWADSYFIHSPEFENPFNLRTLRLLDELTDLESVEFSNYPVDFEGRAADELVQYVSSRNSESPSRCRPPHWVGESYMDPVGIEIDPNGNVTFCPGICIGNTSEQSLPNIMRDYDPNEHPIIRALVEDGPNGLYRMCKAKGLCDVVEYVDDCHLCYMTRRLLRGSYPRELSPESCYEVS